MTTATLLVAERPVAIVTGGSRGIGAAIAKRLAACGWRILVTYRADAAAAEATVSACLSAAGGEPVAAAVLADTRDAAACSATVDAAIAQFGRLDALVNNAGITRDGLAIRMKDEDWSDVIATNLTGCFLMARAAAKVLLKQRRGRIVNISSVAGQLGNAGQANYAAAKSGLEGLTRTFAHELASRGVTVNAVAPGFISTDMTAALTPDQQERLLGAVPLGRPGTPEDVAAAVAFLLSPDAAYITGQTLNVDGGLVMR